VRGDVGRDYEPDLASLREAIIEKRIERAIIARLNNDSTVKRLLAKGGEHVQKPLRPSSDIEE